MKKFLIEIWFNNEVSERRIIEGLENLLEEVRQLTQDEKLFNVYEIPSTCLVDWS